MLQSKYKSSKIVYNGIKFDSKLECNIYKRIEELGIGCELQPSYQLQPKFMFDKHIIRPINYIADFRLNINNVEYILDAKGLETQAFKLKKKMFMYVYKKDIILIKSVKGFNEWYEKVSNNRS